MKTQYRQGDILLKLVKLPQGNRCPILHDPGRIVLAYGEATGHAHVITAPNVDFFTIDNVPYLTIGADTVALNHEEHGAVPLAPHEDDYGYEVVRQREYAPAAIRLVND